MKDEETAIIFDYDLTLVDLKLKGDIILYHLNRACEILGLEDHVRGRTSAFRAYKQMVDVELRDSPELPSVKRMLDNAMAVGEMEAAGRATPVNDSREVLGMMHAAGAEIGVVSSNSVRILESTARRHHIWPMFESVWGRESPGLSKPSPDKLLGCARELSNRPLIYVGDDPGDMVAAKAAGLVGVAIRRSSDRVNTPEDSLLRESGASYILDTLGEIPSVMTLVAENASLRRPPN